MLVAAGEISFAVVVGRSVGDRTFWWKSIFCFLPPTLLYLAYEYFLWEGLAKQNDWIKLVIVAFVNPLVFEV